MRWEQENPTFDARNVTIFDQRFNETRTGLLRQQLGSYYHSCVILVYHVMDVKEGSDPRRRGVEHVGKAAVQNRVVRLRASG